ncbi:AcrR family transcriptional regulator [Nocardioides daedukensis]|uniref:AcrR family transcriptional regulator n=1 Tax=Nocardioides daedukensis TaxID=634462 RepID=A0A7Y9UPC3_9ACTN|nr:AcrR family transcriptional regulator [Nocardioides daedukensis]
MSESANTLEKRKVSTTHRITICAQKLTDQRGFDGFTMDELAEAAQVSRRTLFNYFPGKLDAVLGPGPELPDQVIETFRAGGPNGDFIADIKVLIAAMVDIKGFDRDEALVARRIFKTNPRLLLAVHERFHAVTELFTDLILDREGQDFGRHRARILINVLACLFDVALEDVLSDTTGRRELDAAYFEAFDTLRGVLSC